MTAETIQSALESEGYDVNAVVTWGDRYYVSGRDGSGLPEIDGHHPVADPSTDL